jgi:hypothetical protein
MTEGQIAKPLSAGRMLGVTVGAFLLGSLIVFGAILPAEFNWDPLGLGRVTGLGRLWAPRQVPFDTSKSEVPLAREFSAGFRSDVIEIPLQAETEARVGNDLEYKVRMVKDAALIYEWSVSGIRNPTEFYYDFHGHTLDGRTEMTVATYKQATGTSVNGALTAPFDGIHGWYFQNQSVNPVVVRVKISGFYELIAPGEAGNEYGIIANVPAAQALQKK